MHVIKVSFLLLSEMIMIGRAVGADPFSAVVYVVFELPNLLEVPLIPTILIEKLLQIRTLLTLASSGRTLNA